MNVRFVSMVSVLVCLACACGEDGLVLEPLSPASVAVSETLRVPLTATGGGDLQFAFVGPEGLPGFRSTAAISGTARTGGEFRWTPLASHVGMREITIQLVDGGSVVAETPLLVSVTSAADAAPIFLRPGAGGTFDLADDPCVLINVEVRDDDSERVTIEEADALPAGAGITQVDDKIAELRWCPTGDQVAAAERYTLPIAADDGTHRTELDYIAVLRSDAKPGCPGDAPVVTIVSPTEGASVESGSGYEIRARVTDDMGLRDAPLMLYTTARPDDPSDPDVTTFEQLIMRPSGDEWTARVPSLTLEDGASETLYVLVSATDNDDETGASCDNRTDSSLLTFEALGGEGGGITGCEPCTASTECETGLCAIAPGGGRCVESCSGGGACTVGECGATSTTEGSVLAGCGPVEDICGGGSGGMCTEDSNEENDSRTAARAYTGPTSGQICEMDDDWYRIDVGAGERVTVTVSDFVHAEGDLDLQIRDDDDVLIGASASTSSEESADHCFSEAGTAYARVFGYNGAENSYSLRIDTEPDPAMCCTDDPLEENDSRTAARGITLSGGEAELEGTICPMDEDWFAFDISAPAQVNVELLIDAADQDLDIELRDPAGGLVGASRGTTDSESIDRRVTMSGRYTVGIIGFRGASSDYFGTVNVSAAGGCSDTSECAIDSVCSAGSCVSRTCTAGDSSCPSGHSCPTFGSGSASECGQECSFNGDCRGGEACKWFPEGRFCSRRGSASNGDACTNAAGCAAQRACVPWPSGTCARTACTSSDDCETDTYCVRDPSVSYSVCARSCWESDTLCRTGYRCAFQQDEDDDFQFVCVP